MLQVNDIPFFMRFMWWGDLPDIQIIFSTGQHWIFNSTTLLQYFSFRFTYELLLLHSEYKSVHEILKFKTDISSYLRNNVHFHWSNYSIIWVIKATEKNGLFYSTSPIGLEWYNTVNKDYIPLS